MVKLLRRIVLIAAATGSLALFLFWSARFVSWPWILSKGEGICLWSADRLLQGRLPYPDPGRPPFAVCAYPIGDPALGALFVAAFGKKLLGLRLLSVLSEAVVGIAGAAILARRTDRLAAAAGGAVLLGLLAVHKFHAVARVDLPTLAFLAIAVERLARFVDRRGTGALVALAAAAAAAVLTKPTAAVTLLASAMWAAVVLRRAPRDLGRLALALLAAAAAWGAVTAVLQDATGGEYLRQTVTMHAWKGTWPSAWIWEGYVRQYAPLLVAGAIALALPADPLLKVLACAATAWAVPATRAAGSDLNYTLGPLVWIALLVASAAGEIAARTEGATSARGRAAAAVPLLLLVAAVLPLRGGPARAADLTPEARAEGETLRRLMTDAHGLTLSEEPFFAVLCGKALWVTDPFALSVLSAHGDVDLRPITDALREGRIARVFLGARLQSDPGITAALRKRYRPIWESKGKLADTRWVVLDPVPDPAPPPAF